MLGGSEEKYDAVEFLYKHVLTLCKKAQVEYIIPTALKPIFKFFLKSRN